MDIQKEIIDAINILIEKKIDEYSGGKDFASVIVGTKGSKYVVRINGGEYVVTNGIGIDLSIGQPVWVRNPGNMANAFIEAIR